MSYANTYQRKAAIATKYQSKLQNKEYTENKKGHFIMMK